MPYRRLFTRDVVADLDITEEAREACSWFGDTICTDGFLELRGIQ